MGFPSPTGPSLVAGRRPTLRAPCHCEQGRALACRRDPGSWLSLPGRRRRRWTGWFQPERGGRHLLGSPALFSEQGPQAAERSFLTRLEPSPPSFEIGELGCSRRLSRRLGWGGILWQSTAEAGFCLLRLWTCYRFPVGLSEVPSRRARRRSWCAFSPFAAQSA